MFKRLAKALIRRVGCKAGSPSWAPPSSEQFPPPWERCLNGLLFVTFGAVPLKFNKYYVIKKLADIFFLSLLASLILEHYANYSFYYAIYRILSRTQSLKAIQSYVVEALF